MQMQNKLAYSLKSSAVLCRRGIFCLCNVLKKCISCDNIVILIDVQSRKGV